LPTQSVIVAHTVYSNYVLFSNAYSAQDFI
jgi:hypothetical protein